MCVTCKIPLNVAESPQADRERAFIRELIDEGRDEAQIKHALVGQYGTTVLALPPASGFDLTVYLVPRGRGGGAARRCSSPCCCAGAAEVASRPPPEDRAGP